MDNLDPATRNNKVFLNSELMDASSINCNERLKRVRLVSDDGNDVPSSNKRSLNDFIINKPNASLAKSVDRGQFLFVDSEEERQSIIDLLRKNYKENSVIRINNIDDLQYHDLTCRVNLDKDGLQYKTGRLFSDESIVLVIDLARFKPEDMSSINDLLQPNPTFEQRPLGKHVKRLCLVSTAMLQGQQSTTPDLWRRVLQMQQTTHKELDQSSWWETIKKTILMQSTLTDEALITSLCVDARGNDTVSLTLDRDNWRHRLFGGIDLDSCGELIYQQGILATLPTGAQLKFYDAPVDDPAFIHELATALRIGRYYTSECEVQLPENITLAFETTTPEFIESMKAQWQKNSEHFDEQQPYALLDEYSIDLLDGYQIIQGKIIKQHPLQSLLRNCNQLVIQGSEWRHEQWVTLHRYLSELPQDALPRVVLNPSQGLLDLPVSSALESPHALVYQVTATDGVESLQSIRVEHAKKLQFRVEDTPLLTALRAGQPVQIVGVSHNPQFASLLKTLSLPSPYLLLNGDKIDLSDVNVQFSNPEPTTQFTSEGLNRLYRLLKKLPPAPVIPINPHHTMHGDFEARFTQLAKDIAQHDCSKTVMPYHQRQALKVLVLKSFRHHPSLHGFLRCQLRCSFPDESADERMDYLPLLRFCQQYPEADKADIEKHFWSLLQHCSLSVVNDLLAEADFATLIKPCHISTLQNILVNITDSMHTEQVYNSDVRKSLRTAFMLTAPSLKLDAPIHQLIKTVGDEVEQLLKKRDRESVRERIARCYRSDTLPEMIADLPQQLLLDDQNVEQSYQKRASLLVQRLRTTRAVFLRGEAGAGKTHLALTVAQHLSNGEYTFVQVQKYSTASELYGGIHYQQDSDTLRMVHKEGPLLQWAQNPNPPLLILDEADLAPEGLLAPLAGLWQSPPVLSFQGRQYMLTDQHCIIFTGNGSRYAERQFDSTLTTYVPEHYIPPLSKPTLCSLIIEPSLPSTLSCPQKASIARQVITLFEQAAVLADDFHYTPRDLQDVVALIKHYVQTHGVVLTDAQCNSVVWQASKGVIQSLLANQQHNEVYALECWYHKKVETDPSVLRQSEQQFQTFFAELIAQNKDLQLDVPPIRQYVQQIWWRLQTQGDSRPCMIIEGPAGWGKDAILNRVLTLWGSAQDNSQWQHIHANPAQWSSLLCAVEYAQNHGQALVISELNLIDPALIDSIFNTLLTLKTKSGFALFLTMNASDQHGRQPLSEAFINRSYKMSLTPLSVKAKKQLIVKQTGKNGLANWLALRLEQYQQQLSSQGSPLSITTQDVTTLANVLLDVKRSECEAMLQQALPLHTRALRKPLTSIEECAEAVHQQAARNDRIISLIQRVNQTPRANAVTVTYGAKESVQHHQIVITEQTSDLAFTILENSGPDPVNNVEDQASLALAEKYFATNEVPPEYYRTDIQRCEFLPHSLTFSEVAEAPQRIDYLGNTVAGKYESINQYVNDKIKSFDKWYTIDQQWQPLPCLSDEDQLVSLSISDERNVDFARDKETGKLLIRSFFKENFQALACFSIIPRRSYYVNQTFQNSETAIVTDENLSNVELDEFMSTYVFNDVVDLEIRPFKALSALPLQQRLVNLQQLLLTFTQDRHVRSFGQYQLLDSMIHQLGTTANISTLYHLFCTYWKVPSRIVSDGQQHAFVEISTDGEKTWQRVDFTESKRADIRRLGYVDTLSSGLLDDLQISVPFSNHNYLTGELYRIFLTLQEKVPDMIDFHFTFGQRVLTDSFYMMLIFPRQEYFDFWQSELGRSLLHEALKMISTTLSPDSQFDLFIVFDLRNDRMLRKGVLRHLILCAQLSPVLNELLQPKLAWVARSQPAFAEVFATLPKPDVKIPHIEYKFFSPSDVEQSDRDDVSSLFQGGNKPLLSLISSKTIHRHYSFRPTPNATLDIKRLSTGEPPFCGYGIQQNLPTALVIDLRIILGEISDMYFRLKHLSDLKTRKKFTDFFHWIASQHEKGMRFYWLTRDYQQCIVQQGKGIAPSILIPIDHRSHIQSHWLLNADPEQIKQAMKLPNARVLSRAELCQLAEVYLAEIEVSASTG